MLRANNPDWFPVINELWNQTRRQALGLIQLQTREPILVQTWPESCSPQTLSSLQEVFDAIWHWLEREKSALTFPWAIEASRFTIAQLVLEHLDDPNDIERIKREVMQRLSSVPNETKVIKDQKPLRLTGTAKPHSHDRKHKVH